MTRCLVLATLATLAGAIAALFWAFVKVGGDFRERHPQADALMRLDNASFAAFVRGRGLKTASDFRLPDVAGDAEEAGW